MIYVYSYVLQVFVVILWMWKNIVQYFLFVFILPRNKSLSPSSLPGAFGQWLF